MDIFGDILESIHLGGGVRFRCDLGAPWGMNLPRGDQAEFHFVVRGNAWLRVPGLAQPLALQGGDFVAMLGGGEHSLSDQPDGLAPPIDELLGQQALTDYGPVRFGGDGRSTQLLCGYFSFDRSACHPLVSALPSLVHLSGGDLPQAAWLQTTLQFMQHETQIGRPGAEAVVNRLVGVLFIYMMRRHYELHAGTTGILAGMADRHISMALGAMHEAPQTPWSLDMLARRIGLSRSAFAVRFHQLVGQTPMQYLAVWRMQRARRLLLDTTLSTAAIAERVGFESVAAFAKSFKKMLGTPPGAYRHQRLQPK